MPVLERAASVCRLTSDRFTDEGLCAKLTQALVIRVRFAQMSPGKYQGKKSTARNMFRFIV